MTDEQDTTADRERYVDDVLGRLRAMWLASPNRPPADRWDLSGILGAAATATAHDWAALLADLRGTVTPNQGFAEDYTATEDDGFAIWAVVKECALALSGMGSWAGIRRMYAALVAGDPGLQERQAKAVQKCAAALEAWRQIDRRRQRGEAKHAYEARMTGSSTREAEEQVAEYLIIGLGEHESGFAKLTAKAVATMLRDQRSNVSPFSFLNQLLIQAQVWTSSSDGSLRAAAKAPDKKSDK